MLAAPTFTSRSEEEWSIKLSDGKVKVPSEAVIANPTDATPIVPVEFRTPKLTVLAAGKFKRDIVTTNGFEFVSVADAISTM